MRFEDKIDVFKAIAEINRVRILIMLQKKSLCVCELTEILQLSISTVSKHLSVLKKAGFIEYEKDGKWINYKVVKNFDNELVKQIMKNIYKWFEDEKIIQQDLLKVFEFDRNKICSFSEKVRDVM